MSGPEFDLLGLGSVSVDEVLRVPRWPEPDTKIRVESRECRLGGLIGLALAAAAKLGARCAYAGRLGTDDVSNAVARALQEAGIDITHAPVDHSFGVVRSTIIAAAEGATRNVFSHLAPQTGAHPELPPPGVIQRARVLLVDHHGVDGSIRATRLAREARVPVVGDFERMDHPRFHELLDLVDHAILSFEFTRRLLGSITPQAALEALWNDNREVIALTLGAEGCWFRDATSTQPQHIPAFDVNATDSTGCGDVFHGAYAVALAEGQPSHVRLRFASAAAALKASHALPTREDLDALLAD